MPDLFGFGERKTQGLPPGTIVYTGKKKAEKVRIQVIDYDENYFDDRFVKIPEECEKYVKSDTITWVNVTGLHETEIIERLGKTFGIHPLVLEDIANTDQRPKLEDYEDYLFAVCKMIFYNSRGELRVEQVSFVIAKNFVISFEESEGDVFDLIRNRIRSGKGKIRKMKSDYLAYALLDAIVDNYFTVLEKVGEDVEDIEEEAINKPHPETINKIQKIRKGLLYLRKSVWPLREVVSSMEKTDSKIIRKSTKPYLRDLYDHTIQAMDVIETFRDIISGQVDVYLSSVSHKMNEIMKLLTVISTIFIPMTFITSLYGMNFPNIPEFGLKYGYFYLWLLLLLIAGTMIAYFRRRGWI
ncbi:MAG: magnesium/cobalt transporter CorA [Candidatus Aenigmarchaeota archaeon]|nr:magnesium/cobalt transporter CorA [Candidatus Aenigmarchaeota archaeon]